jgi:hypothetical protein
MKAKSQDIFIGADINYIGARITIKWEAEMLTPEWVEKTLEKFAAKIAQEIAVNLNKQVEQ